MTEAVQEQLSPDILRVIDGVEMRGTINTPDDKIRAHVESAIRRGLPQVWRQQTQPDRVCLVGSGPSLADTFQELRDLVFDGAMLVTVNGAYHYCLERNLQPHAQIVMDARPSNVRFVEPAIPRCRYYLASQCHPDLFDAVEGRELVAIFHATDPEGTLKPLLDAFYLGRWQGIAGGTTVATRALALLRMLGYLRFDIFGVDSCWMNGAHHAFDQPENANDKMLKVELHPTGHPELGRTFFVAPWMLKQVEDFLQMLRINGQHFLLRFHGDGLMAYVVDASAQSAELDMQVSEHVQPEAAA